MQVQRLPSNPIIVPDMDEQMGRNINGPSLIRVPEWVAHPLGRYYLYFAHHQGRYIRLAYADDIQGPWRIHSPGVLDAQDAFFSDHIASPDVHVMDERREIWMYYHGHNQSEPGQFTRLAISTDGLAFRARPEILGNSYWRMFRWQDWYYTLEMPGHLRRSANGLTTFEAGPLLFTSNMRHAAVRRVETTLQVFYSNAGDCPEHILLSTIDLTPDWQAWKNTAPVTVLKPEMDYEGASLPVLPSKRGAIHEPAHQLRDPCVFEEKGHVYLLYSVAGESGIALAELQGD